MAEDAGSIFAEIRLEIAKLKGDTAQVKKYLSQLEVDVKKSAAEAGDRAGRSFLSGIKNGFKATGEEAKKLGENIAKSLTPALIGLTVGIKTIMGIGGAIKDALMANEQFKKSTEDLKTALGASFSAAMRPVSDFFAGLIQRIADSINQTKTLKEVMDNLKKGIAIGNTLADEQQKIVTAYEKEKAVIAATTAEIERQKKLGYGIDSWAEWNNELNKANENLKKLEPEYQRIMAIVGKTSTESQQTFEDIEAELTATEKQIELLHGKHAIDDAEMNQMRLSALNNYINAVSKLAIETDIAGSNIEAGLNKQIEAYNKLKKEIEATKNETKKELTLQEKITAARDAAEEKYAQAVLRANDAKAAGLIDQVQLEEQLAAALAQEYADLEAIVTQYKITEGATIKLRDNVAGIVKENQDAAKAAAEQAKAEKEQAAALEKIKAWTAERTALLAEQSDTLAGQEIARARENGQIARAIELENELIALQRQREREALTQSDAFLAASFDEAVTILENFDAVTEGMKQAAEKINFKETALQIGETAVSAFSDIAGAITDITQQNAQEAIAEVERTLEETNAAIEEARQKALEAEGFAEAKRAEDMQAQIDAAIAANDEVLQYQLERRQRELEINEEYDAQAKAADEKAKQEKAQLEYEAALTSWQMQLGMAIANLPMTVMSAIEAGWNAGKLLPLPGAAPALAGLYAGLAGAASGVQLAAIGNARPTMPHFATGGIVPGQNYGKGDNVAAMLTPGEVILNAAHQDTLATKLGGDLTIPIYLDGRIIAEVVVEDYINKGRNLIDHQRGIR
jgi:hypothetical protein